MYTIYHIFGKKVGCTSNFPYRCYEQGYLDGQFEVLDLISDSCGGEFAGDIEWAWADWFGYKRRAHYRQNWNSRLTPVMRSGIGKLGGDALTRKQKLLLAKRGTAALQALPAERKREIGQRRGANAGFKHSGSCPHCGQKGNIPALHRWHFANCPKA